MRSVIEPSATDFRPGLRFGAWGRIGAVVLLAAGPCLAQQRDRWWLQEPVRLVQTNLRETDSGVDAARLVERVERFGANTLLFGMGGIVAHYPTDVELHERSPSLPPGRDTFGEVLAEARRRGIRVIGRFDLSKAPAAVYEAHPEWFFRRADGRPVVDHNGLHSTCINGGYYRGKALEILTEALRRYPVDGLFFNMFGNHEVNYYTGEHLGLCRCDSCRRMFRQRHGRDIPERPDGAYRRFMRDSSREVAAMIRDLVRAERPDAAFMTYIDDMVDVIMSESNTHIERSLPLWPYSASEQVGRALNSQPGKMAFNLCMAFVDFRNRFATVPGPEIRLRLRQNIAHGGALCYAMLGTMDQYDRTGLAAAGPVFRWHAGHEELYVGQRSAAEVAVLAGGARSDNYRGLFQMLTELHVPFFVCDNFAALERRLDGVGLVVCPEGPPEELDAYLRGGGRVLAAGSQRGGLEVGRVVRRWEDTSAAYWRIEDHTLFPSLEQTDILFLHGPYLELEPPDRNVLTMIPPASYAPPEKVSDMSGRSDRPGLILRRWGAGRLAYLPWDVGALYHLHSSDKHRALAADLIDHLLPDGRQLRTDAHPLVEITVMRQPARDRTLVHFVNASGHFITAYHEPAPMREIRVQLRGAFRSARSAKLGRRLEVQREGDYSGFVLPELGGYDVVVLEPDE